MAAITDEKVDEEDDGMASVGDFVNIYMIQLDICGAHDLQKADRFGKSDPYCTVSAFSTSYSTATIMKDLNPKWNDHVDMTFFNDPKKLKFVVFDWDKGTKDDPIGDCECDLTGMYDESHKGFEGRIPLQNCKHGEIEIKVTARKLLPLELEKNLARLQDQVKKNNDDIKEVDDKIAGHNNQINTLNQENEQLQNNINGLNDEIPKLEEELKNLQASGQNLDAEIEKQTATEADVDKEFKQACDDLDGVNDEIADNGAKIEKLQNENENLSVDIENLKKQIKEKEDKAKKEREEKEKESAKQYDDDKKENDEKPKEVEITPKEHSNDPATPLVEKSKPEKDDAKSGCCCIL